MPRWTSRGLAGIGGDTEPRRSQTRKPRERVSYRRRRCKASLICVKLRLLTELKARDEEEGTGQGKSAGSGGVLVRTGLIARQAHGGGCASTLMRVRARAQAEFAKKHIKNDPMVDLVSLIYQVGDANDG